MKLFRTLKEARAYIKKHHPSDSDYDWYRLKGKVYKYAVGSRFDWRCWKLSH